MMLADSDQRIFEGAFNAELKSRPMTGSKIRQFSLRNHHTSNFKCSTVTMLLSNCTYTLLYHQIRGLCNSQRLSKVCDSTKYMLSDSTIYFKANRARDERSTSML